MDRNGTPLVQNVPSFDLLVVSRQLHRNTDGTIPGIGPLAAALGRNPEELALALLPHPRHVLHQDGAARRKRELESKRATLEQQIAGLRKIYDEAIALRTGERFVSDQANDHFSALCPTIVLDDADQAFKIGTPLSNRVPNVRANLAIS